MTDELELIQQEATADTRPKLKKPIVALASTYIGSVGDQVTWSPNEIDKLEIQGLDDFSKIVTECRYFYRRDPIASTVINKLVEISMTGIIFEQEKLSDNEFRVFTGIQSNLEKFMESCTIEYLISGIVIPEIKYAPVTKRELMKLGVKKYNTLTLPISMWTRDPTTVEINTSMVLDHPSYFVVLPDELVYFIRNEGKYPDGTEDKELYNMLKTYYPEFIKQVMDGNKKILLNNKLITRRKVLTGSQYPTPYLYPALETLRHKRNLRRMDYAIASRIIGAIQLFRLGDKDFPITEDDEEAFDAIKDQMAWRNTSGRDIEKIFQLFANHTLQIDWIMPESSDLLNAEKYNEINQDIFFSLGFPRILTTGETLRTQTSNSETATISPLKTMQNIQKNLLHIIEDVVYNIYQLNKLRGYPEVRFREINLNSLSDFLEELSALYETGGLSRTTYLKEFGYNIDDELEIRKREEDKMKKMGLTEFSPKPFSPQPNQPQNNTNEPQNNIKKDEKEVK